MKHTMILRITALTVAVSMTPTYAKTRLKQIKEANNQVNTLIPQINKMTQTLAPDLRTANPAYVFKPLQNIKGKKGYSDELKKEIQALNQELITLAAQIEIALKNVKTKQEDQRKLAQLAELQKRLENAKEMMEKNTGGSRGRGRGRGR